MSGKPKKPKKVRYAGAEEQLPPGESEFRSKAFPVLPPSIDWDAEDEHAGKGVPDTEKQVVGFEVVMLKDYRQLSAYLRSGGELTQQIREFLAPQLRLNSFSEHLLSDREVDATLRIALAEMCEDSERFLRRRPGVPPTRSSFVHGLVLALAVADLVREGLRHEEAYRRLAEEFRARYELDESLSSDVFRKPFEKYRDHPYVRETLDLGRTTQGEFERDAWMSEHAVGLTLDC